MLDLQGCYILFLIRGNLTFRVGIFIRRLEQSIRMVDTNALSTQNITNSSSERPPAIDFYEEM